MIVPRMPNPMTPRVRRFSAVLVTVPALLLLPGCVQRTLHVTSDPPGALVWMNGQEVGRTPFERDFTWYGTYDVQVRKEGFQTLDTRSKVIAPWWQWPPFDFFAEFWPGRATDERRLHYTLAPAPQQVDPQAVLARAAEMRGQLESSPHTRQPTTRSATQPAPTTR